MRKLSFMLAFMVTVSFIAAPAAMADPLSGPGIDDTDDRAGDEDHVVGEEMCATPA